MMYHPTLDKLQQLKLTGMLHALFQLCHTQPCLHTPVATLGQFAVDHQAQSFFERHGTDVWNGFLLLQGMQHAG